MSIPIGSIFGRNYRIMPALSTFRAKGVKIGNGTQLINAPAKCLISNIALSGGASFNSEWAALRGAVLKFTEIRPHFEHLNGNGFVIPTGHILMDAGGFEFTLRTRNKNIAFPHQEIEGLIAGETLYLVHSSYYHPKESFLPKGTFTTTEYNPKSLPDISRVAARGGALYLLENELDKIPGDERPADILKLMSTRPQEIIVQLKEGGHIILRDAPSPPLSPL